MSNSIHAIEEAGRAPDEGRIRIEVPKPDVDPGGLVHVDIESLLSTLFSQRLGLFSVAAVGNDAEETAKGFEAAGTRYDLRKVRPQ